jgi:hypothetical protein
MNTLIRENYFQFEEDFVEENVRCIPMIVRFKLDACGIKLKLKEWSKMSADEREFLAVASCNTPAEITKYKEYLIDLIFERTGNAVTEIPVFDNPVWSREDDIPFPVLEKLHEFNWEIPLERWVGLSDLQRFALLKLSYPGHENANFPVAVKEFGLA